MSFIIDQCYVCQSLLKFSTYTFPYVVSSPTIRLAYDLFHLFPFPFLFGLIILLPSAVSMCLVLPSYVNCIQFCPYSSYYDEAKQPDFSPFRPPVLVVVG